MAIENCHTPGCKGLARGTKRLCASCDNLYYKTVAKRPDIKVEVLTACLCGCGAAVPGLYKSGHNARTRERIDDGLTAKERSLRKLRSETFAAYGGAKCTCCGETEEAFLVLDHKNGGGKAHRTQAPGSGATFYAWLRSNGFPQEPVLQVLCANCNMAKERTTGCPHQWKGDAA